MDETDRTIFAKILKLLEEDESFHVQASEQDGGETFRLAVSHGGDAGRWFTILVEFRG